MLAKLLGRLINLTQQEHRQTRKVTRTRRMRGENLERRHMFSVLSPESLVNTTTQGDQYEVASASAGNGSSVTVWTHEYSTTNTEVYAQRLNPVGEKVGPQIRVARTSRSEHSPDVAMASNGDFVVVWSYDHSSSDTDIKAQRFRASGSKLGSVLNVSTSSRNETQPSVAMAGNGDFIVAWTHEYSDRNDNIRAKRFSANGRPLGSAFWVANSFHNERAPDIAASEDGRFAVAYVSDVDRGDVLLSQYAPTGALAAKHEIAVGSFFQSMPSVAMDNDANAVVVWQESDDLVGSALEFDVKSRRIQNDGSLGKTMIVAATLDNESEPEVDIQGAGDTFLVSFQNHSRGELRIIEMSRLGQIRSRHFIETETFPIDSVTVSFGVGELFRLTYSQWNSSETSDIYTRRGVISRSVFPIQDTLGKHEVRRLLNRDYGPFGKSLLSR